MKKDYPDEQTKSNKLQRDRSDRPITSEYVWEDLFVSQSISMIMSVLRSSVRRSPNPNYGQHNVRENAFILLAALLCTVYYAQASSDVNIMANLCYPDTFTNEFAFTKPVKCITNPPGNIVQCPQP